MPDTNELAQLLWQHIETFCKEHQCEVRLFAPLPPKLAELIGVTEAIIPATLLVVPKQDAPPKK